MKLTWCGTAALSCLLSATAFAQAGQTIELDDTNLWHGHPFLARLTSGVDSGAWAAETRLLDYDRMHRTEHFVVFEQAGSLYRLDATAALSELENLLEPLNHLAAVQHDLAAAQIPLAEQQNALGEQMRATRNPAAMGRIGREQGSIGRQQGKIGREQGTIGRQQGLLGRAFYQDAQSLISKCLQDGSCHAVAPATPVVALR